MQLPIRILKDSWKYTSNLDGNSRTVALKLNWVQNIKGVQNKIIGKDRVKIITPFNSFIHVYLCLKFDKNRGGFLPFLNGQRTHGI